MNRRTLASALLTVFFASSAAAVDLSKLNLRLEPRAGLPYETLHFSVEAYGTTAEKTGRLLESTYLDFVDVTGLTEFRLPKRLRVIVFETREEFRKKTGAKRQSGLSGPDAMATYEQERLERILMLGAVDHFFDAFMEGPPNDRLRWLKTGLAQTVLARRSGLDREETRERLHRVLKRDGPTDASTLMLPQRSLLKSEGERRRFQLTSASLVSFLAEWGGGLNFSFLLNQVKSGRSMDDALAKAYPGKFRNFQELYDFWRARELGL